MRDDKLCLGEGRVRDGLNGCTINQGSDQDNVKAKDNG